LTKLQSQVTKVGCLVRDCGNGGIILILVDTIEGLFHARISGTISADVYAGYIMDEGVWKSIKGTGLLKGVKALDYFW